MNMTINELIATAHEDAKKAGWWDEERNTGELLMLIVSECGEALEAHRSGKMANLPLYEKLVARTNEINDASYFRDYIKDTFEDELADIVIRIADLCGSKGWEMSPANRMADGAGNIGEQLLNVVIQVVSNRHEPGIIPMNNAMSLVWGIANAHGIDLWRHIELKLAYNLTRPKKHGKAY